METRHSDFQPELKWLPEKLPFPMVVDIFTQDTSKFAEVYAKLLELGLIPKPLIGEARSIAEIRRAPNIGWQMENCLVLPVPGKEYMVSERDIEEGTGWGIYRAVFRDATRNRTMGRADIPPSLEFKYCLRYTPKSDLLDNRVLETDPMGHHIRQLLQILNPTKIVENGRTIK
ncbi:hypothetical protein A2272_02960 [Candidatus Peregrinibacteria bacterium RIFOXYA12_FULL_33_12]|nr:MAG: hypothetical protein A2263_02290 [Candidatus Peregrinibacteria bacterium RIFOXYA2_FULL_33_21]OGJ46623.1 MAG: hypothetical protein A2272_02960 [Candidatus Peregrinibacteria bacterium RIFOXYA12_FULL_33_12]OGJ51535.1 MAG: hypothetical protein A2307_01075 [Candidatus Peregrinibacteria bacterium RIFOXYB2_FULL_33_20]